jgi:hypothetical protein
LSSSIAIPLLLVLVSAIQVNDQTVGTLRGREAVPART